MVSEKVILAALEKIRTALPDPFRMPEQLDAFFDTLQIQEILENDRLTAKDIVAFVEDSDDASLVSVAIIVLSRFDPDDFYPDLLRILKGAGRSKTEAFEHGLWMFHLPETDIAKDLVGITESTGNPNPLLLLQRDVARDIRDRLRHLIESGDPTCGLYAMYSYGYALDPEDKPFLAACSRRPADPELRALAGLLLLDLGSIEGHEGILAGLQSADETLRTMTLFELSKRLPKTLLETSGYTPLKSPKSQNKKAAALIDALVAYLS